MNVVAIAAYGLKPCGLRPRPLHEVSLGKYLQGTRPDNLIWRGDLSDRGVQSDLAAQADFSAMTNKQSDLDYGSV